MIRVRGVDKFYGGHAAVSDLNFEIADGECVGLLGLNGAGKSTTLMMLSCLLEPSKGHIDIDGIAADERPEHIRQSIGYLPEKPPLYGEMTVRGYLNFAGTLRGMERGMLDERITEVAELCDLGRVLGVQIGTLSHGFQQRVGIAQAILHRPKLLILDEPTQGLDPLQISEVRELIRGLRGRHTILLSTHILSEIEAVCDRILVLHEGHLAAQGTEQELVTRFSGGGGSVEIEVRGDAAALSQATSEVQTAVGSPVTLHIHSTTEHDGLIRAQVRAQTDVRPALSRAIVAANLDLLSLRQSRSGLEAMFANLETQTGPGAVVTVEVSS
ncbi:MAG: ABC transporter ATP-binding protein [Myxococcales bacterium]|nr:ABC transporter ATP-binding protein [Myxococcales bacterium]